MVVGAVGRADPRCCIGGLPRAERDRPSRRSRADDGPPLLLATLKAAGGTGLNLTAANQVVHVDRWRNPWKTRRPTGPTAFGRSGPYRSASSCAPGRLEERDRRDDRR